jgi:hypothetical protein
MLKVNNSFLVLPASLSAAARERGVSETTAAAAAAADSECDTHPVDRRTKQISCLHSLPNNHVPFLFILLRLQSPLKREMQQQHYCYRQLLQLSVN